MRAATAAGVLLATVIVAGRAEAGLSADADTVAGTYARTARIVRPPPRLYSSGTPNAVTLPLDATATGRPGCTTVVALGAVSTAFALTIPAEGEDEEQGEQVASSVAGLSQVTRCGAGRADLSELSIDVRSPHAVIELVVAMSTALLAPARSALPNREPGRVPPLAAPGPAPSPGPIANRVLRLESRLAREGNAHIERKIAKSDATGAGRALLDLAPGCHRLTLFAVPSDATEPFLDVDAELAWASGGIASVDRTESPDASLVACTATRDLGILAFAGAAENGSVLVVHARTELPAAIPPRWGPARARVARTLLERHIPAPAWPPIYESLGIAGITVLPLELEPGRCYLAAVASLQGDIKLLALNASAGGPASQSHVDDTDQAAIAAFCAGTSVRGTLEVEVHGSSPIWIAAVWPSAERRLGEESP